MKSMFWFCFIVTLLVALIFLVFFFIGLSDKSISDRNIGQWVLILVACIVAVFGSYYLHSTGKTGWALTLLALPTFLGCIGLLYIIVVVLFSGPGTWR